MKILMAASLVILGVIWIHYTTLHAKVSRVRALSEAAQFESNLNRYLSTRLNEEEMKDLFPTSYNLRLGGETPYKNFREMISDISRSGSIPMYPGIVATLIGLIGLFVKHPKKKTP